MNSSEAEAVSVCITEAEAVPVWVTVLAVSVAEADIVDETVGVAVPVADAGDVLDTEAPCESVAVDVGEEL